MSMDTRIESALKAALSPEALADCPPLLASSLPYAVFPGGARIRPTILLSVAMACGDDKPAVTDAAAVALELMHCASLVHDDLPSFDDADMRRGKPSLHKAYNEPLAVLAGDSLLIRGFEVLAAVGPECPDRSLKLISKLGQLSGACGGICAGQAWESEDKVDLAAYHQSKTGALFIAATQMGAIAAGAEPEPWFDLGMRIGSAFQIADDLKDALVPAEVMGKPAGQDSTHQRPTAVQTMGIAGATKHLQDILAGAIASIPSCPGEAKLAQLVQLYAQKIMDIPAAADRS
ncbi:geranylgeranyl pyrophosphate synthase [Rhodobacter sp. TJ_12]|uniref:polyprenyl synthetase family protein n=1 Tax=Rhodobacter sp. TJ_12 TaxID=2029399 RepID=UPI001CBD609C|nr:polyprenyl synthetase family protein [Rhodobacter sp. TJ_12]MBZ4022336.1 geranylgeranyl pyrophosphate synthase [Rhodobacter sp. TJ_12]